MALSYNQIKEIVKERNPDENETTISNMSKRIERLIDNAVMEIFEEEA